MYVCVYIRLQCVWLFHFFSYPSYLEQFNQFTSFCGRVDVANQCTNANQILPMDGWPDGLMSGTCFAVHCVLKLSQSRSMVQDLWCFVQARLCQTHPDFQEDGPAISCCSFNFIVVLFMKCGILFLALCGRKVWWKKRGKQWNSYCTHSYIIYIYNINNNNNHNHDNYNNGNNNGDDNG